MASVGLYVARLLRARSVVLFADPFAMPAAGVLAYRK
jgi:hypothetical protein